MTIAPTITCNQCGISQTGPGLAGWWRIDYPPEVLDTSTFSQLWPPYDLCSWACVEAFAAGRK